MLAKPALPTFRVCGSPLPKVFETALHIEFMTTSSITIKIVSFLLKVYQFCVFILIYHFRLDKPDIVVYTSRKVVLIVTTIPTVATSQL
jgi:hypothetical protein